MPYQKKKQNLDKYLMCYLITVAPCLALHLSRSRSVIRSQRLMDRPLTLCWFWNEVSLCEKLTKNGPNLCRCLFAAVSFVSVRHFHVINYCSQNLHHHRFVIREDAHLKCATQKQNAEAKRRKHNNKITVARSDGTKSAEDYFFCRRWWWLTFFLLGLWFGLLQLLIMEPFKGLNKPNESIQPKK